MRSAFLIGLCALGCLALAACSGSKSNGNSGTPVPASSGLTVYGDSRATSWDDESFNATVDYDNTRVVYSGSKAIAFTVTAPNGHLLLHTDIPVDLAPFRELRFAMRASQTGQSYAVALWDANDKQIATPLQLANYGGDPTPGRWTFYRIPIRDLDSSGQPIKDIEIIDGLGKPQPVVYIDDLGFS